MHYVTNRVGMKDECHGSVVVAQTPRESAVDFDD
jgi:hypothetical protein